MWKVLNFPHRYWSAEPILVGNFEHDDEVLAKIADLRKANPKCINMVIDLSRPLDLIHIVRINEEVALLCSSPALRDTWARLQQKPINDGEYDPRIEIYSHLASDFNIRPEDFNILPEPDPWWARLRKKLL